MYPAFPLEYKPVSFTISARCHPPKTGETNFYREPHLAPVSRIPPQPIAPKNLECLRIRCTASLNFIKKLLGSLPDG